MENIYLENSSLVKVWEVSVIVDKLIVYQMYNWHGVNSYCLSYNDTLMDYIVDNNTLSTF